MTTKDYTTELIDVVTRRTEVLKTLYNEPTDKRTLVDRLDPARATIDRSVRELEQLGLLEYQEGEYKTNPCGTLAIDLFKQFENQMYALAKIQPILQHTPELEGEIDLNWFRDATVINSTSADPYAPANRHADMVKKSDSFQALLPAVGLNQLEAAKEAVIEKQQKQQVIVGEQVADLLCSKDHYREKMEEMIRTGYIEISISEKEIPCFLGIYDQTVHIGVDDEDGRPCALVETHSNEARSWALEFYHKYKQDSEPFSISP